MKGLSKEQIEKIKEISKLSSEEQKKVLPEFLKTLSPEQREFLMKQQQTNKCIFCGIVDGSVDSKKIYEDNFLVAVLDIRPANKGHTLVIPKKHYQILSQIPNKELEHIFNVANKLNSKIFELVEAEGSNILVANGALAGQNVDHVAIHIIPRFSNDGIDFGWEAKKISGDEMNLLQNRIREKVGDLLRKRENKPRVSKSKKLPKEFIRIP